MLTVIIPQNGSGYSNPAYDALSDKLAVEFDPAKRRQLVIDMQKIILDDAATIFWLSADKHDQ